MLVKDSAIMESIVRISDHYNNNIATRFIRPMLAGILSDNELSNRISDMTGRSDSYTLQGYHLDELYQQILALARFVYLVRTEILPNIRSLAAPSLSSASMDRVFREMAINNFGANLQMLSDYVNELYLQTINYDKVHSPNGKPIYRDVPGLQEIGRYLVGR